MDAHWKPATYPQVIPYLVVDDADGLMDFVLEVFGGTPADRVRGEDGATQHGEVRIGASMVMMGRAREPGAATKAMVYVYVPDVDATYRAALAAGATSVAPPTVQPYGDRSAGVRDRWDNQWFMATHLAPSA